jgi:tRNA threonylcarbamoyladenosine biosynthesis protein TsaE
MMHVKGNEEMAAEAARFVATLFPRGDGATVVALSGDLGAGKTAFVKGAAQALGVTEHVTSPTFVIMKIYPLRGAFKRLVHIDAYRLKGEHHLKVLGWDEILADPANLIFIEWPGVAGGAIPQGALRLSFRYSEDDGREIHYETQEAVGAA